MLTLPPPKDATRAEIRRVIAHEKPRLLKELLMEAGIFRDDYTTEQAIRKGSVMVGRNSAHLGMTLMVTEGEVIQIRVFDDLYILDPVSRELFLSQ